MAESPPPLSSLLPASLFLDFDGTLVDLADAPDAIDVAPALTPRLGRLSRRLGGRLAVVSGRAVADLQRHLGECAFILSGSHGAELRYPDGTCVPVAAPEGLAAARDEIRRFAESRPGLLIEEKPAGIALHFRQAPDRGTEAEPLFSRLAAETGLNLLRGKMVLELRPSGSDKGAAVRRLMGEPPFAGTRPLFVGDDVTDEDAFEAAAALRGAGILVGAARDTAAKWRLSGVRDVALWLDAAIDA
jgi:trehalose 6-phosphate phosphatase